MSIRQMADRLFGNRRASFEKTESSSGRRKNITREAPPLAILILIEATSA